MRIWTNLVRGIALLSIMLASCSPTSARIEQRATQNYSTSMPPVVEMTSAPYIITPTSTPTLTPSPTLTPTQELYPVINSTFFDYNGNGTQDEGEPSLEEITLTYNPGNSSCTTDASGMCTVNIPAGTYRVSVKDPSGRFRYILPSVSEIIPIRNGLVVVVGEANQNTVLVPLAEGFLTKPFKGDFPIDRMYDHDPSRKILWWNGEHQCAPDDNICYAVPPGTNDHPGIDYRMPIGTPILAAGPGRVRSVDECNGATVIHPVTIDGRPIYTMYAHLSRVAVNPGQEVKRGDLIGYSGSTCTPYSHLHFDLRSSPNDPNYWAFIDPYKPIVELPSGFWLSGYTPVWTDEYHPANNIGWWTVLNDPKGPK